MELLERILDALGPAANGDADASAKGVEAALAKGLTLAIGWLAKIAGIGDLGKKVKGIIEKIQKPFNKIIDWCIDKVLQGIDWLKSKLGGGGKDEDAAKKAVQEVDEKAKQDGSAGGSSKVVQGNEASFPNADGSGSGANDNATGVAGVLESARVLSRYKFENNIGKRPHTR